MDRRSFSKFAALFGVASPGLLVAPGRASAAMSAEGKPGTFALDGFAQHPAFLHRDHGNINGVHIPARSIIIGVNSIEIFVPVEHDNREKNSGFTYLLMVAAGYQTNRQFDHIVPGGHGQPYRFSVTARQGARSATLTEATMSRYEVNDDDKSVSFRMLFLGKMAHDTVADA